MAVTDTLSATLSIRGEANLTRAGDVSGTDNYLLAISQAISDGAGRNNASIAIKGALSVGTAFTAIDLSAVDVFGSMGDAAPSATSVAGTFVRGVIIYNSSTSGHIMLSGSGANALTGIFATQGAAPTYEGIRVGPGGVLGWYSASGTIDSIAAAGTRNLFINSLSTATGCTAWLILG